MEKLDRQIYLRDMDDRTAEIVGRIKSHFNEKTSKKAIERLIENFFPLMEEVEKLKLNNNKLNKAIENERFELNSLIIKVKALLRADKEREEIKASLTDALDIKG